MTSRPSPSQDRSLLAIVLDVTPSVWGERDLVRSTSDRDRHEKGKRSVGPATLNELVSSVLAFVLAFSCLNRENCVIVVAVAGDECTVVYPRKGGKMSMTNAVNDPPTSSKVDAKMLHDYLKHAIAELAARDAAKAEKASIAAAETSGKNTNSDDAGKQQSSSYVQGAAIAAGLSLALCCINRFMVAAHGGVSALTTEAMLRRQEDEGILALMADSKSRKAAEEREQQRRARGVLSPRILIIQAAEDRTRDYNAFMNCTFAAIKGEITIDGCFIPSGIGKEPKTSFFLEQACDRTKGIFLAPPGPAQAEGALTEVMISVFMAPVSARKYLNLPVLNKVDFRARCFETGESVDIANVCNQCLSIFKNKPKDFCPTCGAVVYVEKKKRLK